jgi:hypothetical protein
MAQRYDRPLTAQADARAQLSARRGAARGALVGREIVGYVAIRAGSAQRRHVDEPGRRPEFGRQVENRATAADACAASVDRNA